MDILRTMRLFVAIAETGSLSAVARRWGVAPSTVSLGLRTLETHLGARLVSRTTRQLALTPDGSRFLDRARQVLGDLDELMQGFDDEGPLSGHVRLTATNDLGRQRIAPMLDTFMRAHPDLSVQLHLSDSILDLVEGGFDIGIRTGPLPDSDLRARLLLRGHKCVCASPSYWKKHGKPEHPRDLSQHDCLVFATPGELQSYWTFRDGDRTFRVQVSGSRQVNDGLTLRRWAIAGAGIVMKSSFDVAEDLKSGRLETALENYTLEQTNLYAVTLPQGRDSRRVREVLDFLSEELAKSEQPQAHANETT